MVLYGTQSYSVIFVTLPFGIIGVIRRAPFCPTLQRFKEFRTNKIRPTRRPGQGGHIKIKFIGFDVLCVANARPYPSKPNGSFVNKIQVVEEVQHAERSLYIKASVRVGISP